MTPSAVFWPSPRMVSTQFPRRVFLPPARLLLDMTDVPPVLVPRGDDANADIGYGMRVLAPFPEGSMMLVTRRHNGEIHVAMLTHEGSVKEAKRHG